MNYRAIISVPIVADENEDAIAQAQAFADAILNESEEIIGQLELVYDSDNGVKIQHNDTFLKGMIFPRSALKTSGEDD